MFSSINLEQERYPPNLETYCQCCSYNDAEFAFETNSAPIGGYADSNQRQVTSGRDMVLMQTMGWTDDFDDLPMTYQFGYTHGWQNVLSVSR